MSKWKCEICGLKFENFHAQGFNHKIYCPLCYYKQLYEINTKEIDRLNNIINELEELLKQMLLDTKKPTILNNFEKNTIRLTIEHIQNKLKELKDSDK